MANREAIVEAARTLLATDPNASMDAIARTAGLSRRAVYGHFTDRDDLLRELIRRGAERFNAVAAIDDDVPAPVALALLAGRLWVEAAQVQVTAAIALDDTHVAQTAAALAPLRARVRAIVADGVHTGVLRRDVPEPVLARVIEETARAAVSRLDADDAASREIALRLVLSVSGLSWTECDSVLSAHPHLLRAVPSETH
nr:TetR/AcrR family transcriptional regulator [Microbacterium aquimaris]